MLFGFIAAQNKIKKDKERKCGRFIVEEITIKRCGRFIVEDEGKKDDGGKKEIIGIKKCGRFIVEE